MQVESSAASGTAIWSTISSRLSRSLSWESSAYTSRAAKTSPLGVASGTVATDRNGVWASSSSAYNGQRRNISACSTTPAVRSLPDIE
jgi:hypothetical protein